MTTRREALLALAAGALTAALPGGAAQDKVRRIGYLANDADPRKSSPTFKALLLGLQELGWVEGRNLEIRIRWSGGNIELFPSLATELMRDNVEVIVTAGTAATRAARVATTTTPIVFASAADPVAQGLVASINRPGANLTGIALDVEQLVQKRVELLPELLPGIKNITALYQAASIVSLQPRIVRAEDDAVRRFGLALQRVAVTNMQSVEGALAEAARKHKGAVMLSGAGLFIGNREAIAKLALSLRLPLVCADSRFAEAGALASYGENFIKRYRRVAVFVDKILRGARPADMPVEQWTNVEFVLNLRTAKALGIEIPKAFRDNRPDWVIE